MEMEIELSLLLKIKFIHFFFSKIDLLWYELQMRRFLTSLPLKPHRGLCYLTTIGKRKEALEEYRHAITYWDYDDCIEKVINRGFGYMARHRFLCRRDAIDALDEADYLLDDTLPNNKKEIEKVLQCLRDKIENIDSPHQSKGHSLFYYFKVMPFEREITKKMELCHFEDEELGFGEVKESMYMV